jgi:hypothetical protein
MLPPGKNGRRREKPVAMARVGVFVVVVVVVLERRERQRRRQRCVVDWKSRDGVLLHAKGAKRE